MIYINSISYMFVSTCDYIQTLCVFFCTRCYLLHLLLLVSVLGMSCDRDDPCLTVTNAECGSTGTCVCADGYIKEGINDRCISGKLLFHWSLLVFICHPC